MSYEIIKHEDAGGPISVTLGKDGLGEVIGSFGYSGLGTIEFDGVKNVSVTGLIDSGKYGSYYALYRFMGNQDGENISFSPVNDLGEVTNGDIYRRDVVHTVNNTQDGATHEDNLNVVRFFDQPHGSLLGMSKPGYYGCGWFRVYNPSINNWKTSSQFGVGAYPDTYYCLSTGWSMSPLSHEPDGVRFGSRTGNQDTSRITGSITFYGITEGRV